MLKKLAASFGLISTSDSTSLQLVQSHRICNDCHNAIKLIALVTKREIVVRDASRSHHFWDGNCSCVINGEVNNTTFVDLVCVQFSSKANSQGCQSVRLSPMDFVAYVKIVFFFFFLNAFCKLLTSLQLIF